MASAPSIPAHQGAYRDGAAVFRARYAEQRARVVELEGRLASRVDSLPRGLRERLDRARPADLGADADVVALTHAEEQLHEYGRQLELALDLGAVLEPPRRLAVGAVGVLLCVAVGLAPVLWRAVAFTATAEGGLLAPVADQALACDAQQCTNDPRCTRHCRGRRIRDYAPLAQTRIHDPADRWPEKWTSTGCSKACRKEGLCQARDGSCFAQTDADCLRSEACAREGRCLAVEGACRERR
jgi:hypothetical protein